MNRMVKFALARLGSGKKGFGESGFMIYQKLP